MSNAVNIWCNANKKTKFALYQEAWEWKNRMKLTPDGNKTVMAWLKLASPPAEVMDYLRMKNITQTTLSKRAYPQ